MKKATIIYHADCPDGFLAATIARSELGDTADYLPYFHGKSLPLDSFLIGRDVYILDFSFNEKEMQYLEAKANKLIILDHHITAKQQLHSFCSCHRPSLFANIDLSKSGAMLTWNYFKKEGPPRIVRAVQSRDIYTWDEPGARAILAILDMQGYSFEKWLPLLQVSDGNTEFWNKWEELGGSIIQKYEYLIATNVASASDIVLRGIKGRGVNNSNKEISNEIGVELSKVYDTFGLIWYVSNDVVKCSLRCAEGFDVEAIAKAYGGGGHTKAAAFTIKIEELPLLLKGQL